MQVEELREKTGRLEEDISVLLREFKKVTGWVPHVAVTTVKRHGTAVHDSR